MAYRQNLRKIGEEAFRLIDQAEENKQRLMYHPTKPTVHYFQPPHVLNARRSVDQLSPHDGRNGYHFHVVPAPVDEKERENHTNVMDCHEAARRYGGMVVTDYYPNKKKDAKWNHRAYY